MSAEKLIASQLRIAREDLRGAVALVATGNRNAAYLLEQSAEKILLAVLTSEEKHGGIKHRLSEMTELLPDEHPLKTRLREVAVLETFATAYRYPTPSGRIPTAPSEESVRNLTRKVEQLLIDVAGHFGVLLDDASKPAAHARPMR